MSDLAHPLPCRQLPSRIRRRAFALCSWMLLAIVLLSAAPSGLQAQVRPVGSAFDPASAAVAIRPQVRLPAARAGMPGCKRAVDDAAASPPVSCTAPAALAARIGGSSPHGEPIVHAGAEPAGTLRRILLARAARAPPTSAKL